MVFEPYLFFATSIHINATSTQLFPTANMHIFFDLYFFYTPLLVLLNTL